jgi:hypothetical protein
MRIPHTLISLLCSLYCVYPHFPFDLGMKILISVGGLFKTFNSINLHVIPEGIGPLKIPHVLISLLSPLYVFPPFDLGMKILIGLVGLCKTFNSINLHVIL